MKKGYFSRHHSPSEVYASTQHAAKMTLTDAPGPTSETIHTQAISHSSDGVLTPKANEVPSSANNLHSVLTSATTSCDTAVKDSQIQEQVLLALATNAWQGMTVSDVIAPSDSIVPPEAGDLGRETHNGLSGGTAQIGAAAAAGVVALTAIGPAVVETTDAAADSSTIYTLLVGQADQGNISSSTDKDWFRMSLVQGQTYTFAAIGTGKSDLSNPYLRLLDVSGGQLAFNDDSGPHLSSVITYTATSTGTFYLEVKGYSSSITGKYEVSSTLGSLASFDIPMGGGALDTQLYWDNTSPLTFGFRSTAASYTTSSDISTFTRLNAVEIAGIEKIFQLYSSLCNINIQEVNPGGYTNSATILIGNYADSYDGAGAFAWYPGSTSVTSKDGDVWLNTVNGISLSNWSLGSYSFFAAMHEIGHALGLSHPGDYNAGSGVAITYSNSAQFIQDSQQYSIMSYFGGSFTGANPGSFATVHTPLLLDIYELQQKYGANTSTRNTNTTYGFGSSEGDVYVFNSGSIPQLCIWDGGGTDTLNCSNYAQSQIISLNQGQFSNIGGGIYNVSIAVGAVIENAVGGTGSDTIIGNEQDNVLTGGLGSNMLTGGAGVDTFVVSGVDTITDLGNGGPAEILTVAASSTASVTLTGAWTATAATINLGTVSLNSNGFSVDLSAVTTGNGYTITNLSTATTLTGSKFNDAIQGGAGNDTLVGGLGNDTLTGGAGNDHIDGGAGNDIATFTGRLANYVIVQNAGFVHITDNVGTDGSDYLVNVERLTFSDGVFDVDTTAPTVATFNPLDGATGVAIGANIVVTFSEALQRGTGNIVLKDEANNVVATYDAATSANLTLSGSTLTINPTADLSSGTHYAVTFDAGSITDLAGNNYAGTDAYDFTTVSIPTVLWTRLLGSSSLDIAKSLTTGVDGAIYVAGLTDGNFDGQTSNGYFDAFITRYNPDSTKAWTQLLGTTSAWVQEQGFSLLTGADGAIYLAGSSSGNLDSQSSSGGGDAFITRYNPDGSKAWTELLGGTSYDQATSLATGTDGAIYVAGYTTGNFDGLTNSGSSDAFLTRYKADGTKVWTQLLGTSFDEVATSLTTGADGAIYVAGYTTGNLGGQTNHGGVDAFITRYNPDGSKAWTQLLGTSFDDGATGLAAGADGAIYVTGWTSGNLGGQTNHGGVDAFITRYNPDGSKAWTQVWGTSLWEEATSITVGANGAIYVAGCTYGDLDGQPNNGGADAFVVRYNPEGTKAWTQLLGGSSNEEAFSLTVGADNAIYVAGATDGHVDGQTSNGGMEAFITKLLVDTTAPNVAIDAGYVTKISGTFAQVLAFVEDISHTTATLGTEAITLTDATVTVVHANMIDAYTTGVVTATLSTGLASTFSSLTGTGNAYSVTLTDTVMDASTLNSLDGKTTAAVNATSVTTLTGSLADVLAAYNANSAGAVMGLGNETVTLSNVVTVAQANTIGGITSGLVTATISNNDMATLAGLSDAQVNNYSITVGDATVAAAELATLYGKTTVAVYAASVVAITGTQSNVAAVYAAGSGEVTGLGNENVILSGTVSVANANVIDAATTGVVTATLTAGLASSFSSLTGTGNAYGLTLTDTSLDAATLSTLDGKTTLVVNAGSILTLTGSQVDILRAYSANMNGTISGLGNEAVTLTGTVTVAQANAIDALTTGVVTATIASSDMSTLANLTGTGNAYTVTISDSTVAAASLTLLDSKTTVAVNASAVTALTGTPAEVTAAHAANTLGTITGLFNDTITLTVSQANTIAAGTSGAVTATIVEGDMATLANLTETGNAYTITVSDVTVSAATLTTLYGKTTVAVNAAAVTTFTGTQAAVAVVYAAGAGEVIGLGNENVTLSDAAVTVANAIVIDAATTGVVTATLTTGLASTFASLTGTGNAYRVTLTDTTLDAGVLNTLDGKTTVAVTATSVTTLTGTQADVLAAYNASTAGTITGLGNEAVTLSGAVTVNQANAVAANTSGVVTATIASSDMTTLAGLMETGNAYSISVADATVEAAGLTTLYGKTTVAVNAAAVITLTGTQAAVATVYAAGAGELSGLGNENVTLTDAAVSVANANVIDGYTTGVVTATLTTGAVSSFSTLTGTGNAYSVTLTDTTLDSATLTALYGKTTVAVNAASVTTLTGTQAAVAAVYASSGEVTGLGNENVTLSDATVSVANANVIDAATTGMVTATLTSGLTSTFASLTGTGNAYRVTLTDTTLDAGVLNTLDGKTTVAVTATSVTTLTGTQADVLAAYNANIAGTITGLGNEAVTITGAVSAAQADAVALMTSGAVTVTLSSGLVATLNASLTDGTVNAYTVSITDTAGVAAGMASLDNKTSGMITASTVTSVSGSYAEVAAVYGSAGITGLGNEAITLSGTVTVAQANTIAAYTTGAVTATIVNNDMATLAGLSDAQVNNYSITVGDVTVGAAALTTLYGKSTLAVNANSVMTLTGTQAEVAAVYAAGAGEVTGLGNENVTLNDAAVTVANANVIDAATTGMVTATLTAGAAASFSSLSGTGNAYSVTLTDTSLDAGVLNTLDGKTTTALNASSITTLTGSQADVLAAYNANLVGTITGQFTTVARAAPIVLLGTTGVDSLSGGAGNDTLTGGSGIDRLDGKAGSDLYMINLLAEHTAAEITDTGAFGVDELRFASTTTSTLSLFAGDTGLELVSIGTGTGARAVTTGTTALNVNASAVTNGLTLLGNDGANTLTGTAYADIILGGGGNDVIDGGPGNDRLTGGLGIDTFTVSSGTDSITDLGLGGADVLKVSAGATANASIGAAWMATSASVNNGVENITTNGMAVNLAAVTTGNGFSVTNMGSATTLTGSALNDSLTGGDGNDVLIGGAGTDVMNGGNGSDIYVFSLIAEHPAAEVADTGTFGIDELRFTSTTATTLSLYAGDTGLELVTIGTGTAAAAVTTGTTAINVDASWVTNGLTMQGNDGANTLTGTAYNDIILGGGGNDILLGGAGNDVLKGGLGNDTLTGGSGSDFFVFDTTPNASTNKDTLTDFTTGVDKIQLSKAIFTALGPLGDLTTDAFYTSSTAVSGNVANNRVVYNTTSGALFYDADGSGSTAAVQIALLGISSHPLLDQLDIQIVL